MALFGKKQGTQKVAEANKEQEPSSKTTPEQSNVPSNLEIDKKAKAEGQVKKGTAPAKETKTVSTSHAKNVFLVVLIVLIVCSVIVGAFFVTKYVLLPTYYSYKVKKELNKAVEEAQPKRADKEAKKSKKKESNVGMMYIIQDITVNTLPSEGSRFVVLEIALETHDQNIINELRNREPQIRDLLIKYFRAYSAQQVLDIDFQEKARKELTELINQRLQVGPIDSLYFTELVVQ